MVVRLVQNLPACDLRQSKYTVYVIVGFLNLLFLDLSATALALRYLLHPCSRPAREGMKVPLLMCDEYIYSTQTVITSAKMRFFSLDITDP